MKIIKEFREFAIKGNVFDMAIGIIIGTAFNKVVTSFVNDILMPPLGFLIDGVNFNQLSLVLQKAEYDASGAVVREQVTLNYGSFIQVSIDFLIIAFSIFTVITVYNRLKAKAEDPEDASAPTPKDIQLLSEIRDILKKNQSGKMEE
jgi:large conductance mechanosensitive channel